MKADLLTLAMKSISAKRSPVHRTLDDALLLPHATLPAVITTAMTGTRQSTVTLCFFSSYRFPTDGLKVVLQRDTT